MRVGFIGLGNMGGPMAHSLVRAGHDVIVFNRTKEKQKPLADAGAKVAKAPGDLKGAEVVITMLSDDAAVESFASADVFGDGAIHLSMSTISPALSKRLARGSVTYVAAPVFGRPDLAAAGKLFVVAAGEKSAIARCQPLLDAIGQRTFIVGEEPSQANVLKITGNFLIAATIEALGESFALVRKCGLDPAIVLDVLTSTLFTAPIHKTYGGIVARGEWDAKGGFGLPLGLKDVRLVLQTADSAGVPMPTASLLHDQFAAAMGRGMNELDWSALGRLVAENAGLA